jgi:ribonuclease Z
MQLMKYSVPIHKIECIFISHLHGDHYLGLMGLLFSMHLQKRTNDLHLYAPKGLDEIILLQLKYSKSSLNFNIHFHPTLTDDRRIIWEDEALSVETIPLIHKIQCTGFLFREKQKQRKIDKDKLPDGILLQHIALLKTGQDILDERGTLLYRNSDFTLPPKPSYSFAFCSDTAFHEKMIEQIKGVSLLYHESTFMETEKDKAKETFHSTATQAAEIARQSMVDKLIIGHFSARYRELDGLLQEARAIFPATELATEGTTFELEP